MSALPLPTLMLASVVLFSTYLAVAGAIAVATALRAGGRRDEEADSYDALSKSRFTIPVSVIIPVTEGAPSLSMTIDRVLQLFYPELECIVVSEGLSPAQLELLTRDWQIEARELFYRRSLKTEDLRRIYRSTRDPRLTIVDKLPGGYADALNCGVNIARYRYVAAIPADVVFESNALLRLMSSPLRDPGRIIGASGQVERIGGFERLASARAMAESRLAWNNTDGGLGPHGAVSVWRRDAVLKAEGFSTRAADPDLDLMFRLQASSNSASRFERGTDIFGRVQTPSMSGARQAAGERQRGVLQLLWTMTRHGHRGLDIRVLLRFLQTEMAVPLAQAWVVAAMVVSSMAGWVSWISVALVVIVLAFGNAAISAASLLVRGAAPGAPQEGELRRLLLLAPLEFIIRRPALALARVVGAKRRL